ncbi:MAG: RsiV family protein [Clostridia bacterium]|nr:RsiV family protein [Clostridia bacterium]
MKEDQNFYINDSGNIVICFDKYEVAAGAQGCPEFEIPKSVVESINK